MFIELSAKTKNLKKIRLFSRDFFTDLINEQQVNYIVLAIDEACQNVIRYAYEGDSDKVIRVEVKSHEDEFIIDIFDQGMVVPLGSMQPAKKISEVSIGGLGLNLINKIVDKHEFISSELSSFNNHLRMIYKR